MLAEVSHDLPLIFAQCLLTINIQRLVCTVMKFLVVKEAKEAVLYLVQDF